LAVDWGYTNITLCVVGDDRPLYTRRIHGCGFGKMLDEIRRVFGVSLDEAQHLVDTQGLVAAGADPLADEPLQKAISDATAETTEELVRQLKRTIQFLELQRRHLHPETVWLLGGGASMRNIGPYLERALRLPVQIWSVSDPPLPLGDTLPHRLAVFGGAVALSALAWRAA
jgi:Tfp pilus assembly PilM family ATPase